jgi:phage baseplate assembly protein W
MDSNFLGRGWACPIAPDERGQIATASDEESIRQSIWIILGTSPGERVMLPDFGCGLYDLIFAVNSPATAGQIERTVRDALVQWEPRIDVLDVHALADGAQPALLLIDITYEVRSTNSRFNLVYPFYLE